MSFDIDLATREADQAGKDWNSRPFGEALMQGTRSAPNFCARCNRELEWVATISRLGRQPETRFFECDVCGGLEIFEIDPAFHPNTPTGNSGLRSR
jgi:hypothetical protein